MNFKERYASPPTIYLSTSSEYMYTSLAESKLIASEMLIYLLSSKFSVASIECSDVVNRAIVEFIIRG